MIHHQERARAVSATEPDWQRERLKLLEWNPGKRLLSSIRDYQRLRHAGFWKAHLRWWTVLRHRFWSAVTGADIPLNCEISGGLLLPHPNGVVIHPQARVGPNCLIFQQVTLGTLETGGAPVVGGHVDIGAGAKLLGSVVIGDHALIGANAVVLSNVLPNHVAVGVPARSKPCTPASAKQIQPSSKVQATPGMPPQ
jgi:serine O-acetyltransferase